MNYYINIFDWTQQIRDLIPVWVRMCRFNREGRSNFLPHTSHGSQVFSFLRDMENSEIEASEAWIS